MLEGLDAGRLRSRSGTCWSGCGRVYGDSEVVTLRSRRGQTKTRATYAEVGERVDRLCRGARVARDRARRPRRDLLPGTRRSTSRSTWACPAWAPSCTRSTSGSSPSSSPTSPTTPRTRSSSSTTRWCRCSRRSRRASRPCAHYVVIGDGDAGSLPNVDPLRGAARPQQSGYDYPRARRARGRRPLLHERHDRQPEGRPLLAPLERPARDGRLHDGDARRLLAATACCRSCRCSTPTPGACPTPARWSAPTW